jgi:hypothetical protein
MRPFDSTFADLCLFAAANMRPFNSSFPDLCLGTGRTQDLHYLQFQALPCKQQTLKVATKLIK